MHARRRRSTSALAALATLLALWLGLDAPSVSPVSPTPVQVVQVGQVLSPPDLSGA